MTKKLPVFLEAMRPRQWLKNVIVGAGPFFALLDKTQSVSLWSAMSSAAAVFVLFCFVSSSVYIMNDLHDIAADKLHPEKRRRPIASGRLSQELAVAESLVLLAAGLLPALAWDVHVAGCLGAYFAMQIVYTYLLKDVVLVDVLVLSVGFVIRVYAGTVAASVVMSHWMLVCAFMVILFVALCKRRHEKASLGDAAGGHRKVLAQYTLSFLDHTISATAATTVLCYAIYTLAPETVAKFGTGRLMATIPFVLFGVYRYMFLTMCKGEGGHPEKTLSKDIPLIADVALYIVAVVVILKVL